MKSSITTLASTLLLAGGLAALASPASALPIAPATPTVAAPSSEAQPIGWRCGPGRHVNRWGRCVRN